MDTQTARLLDSTDAKQRFAAIKKVARSKDVTALKKLAQLAEGDPDEQVRDVAAKAVRYIKADSKVEVQTDSAAPAAPKPREVSEKEQARAKGYIDAAIGYQINGERDRALRELAKALAINPSLEFDMFYKSVLEEATGTTGEEALQMARNPEELKSVVVTEKKLKHEKRQQEHMENVNRSTWASAAMDLVIYTLILTFASVLMVLMTGQLAQNFLTGQEAAWAAYNNGEVKNAPEPVDPTFISRADQVSTLSFPIAIVAGLSSGIGGLISLLINLLFTHLAARTLFGGRATLPHLVYKVASFYNGRLPILYGLVFVTLILTFALGGGIISAIGSLVIGVYSLLLFFKLIGRIGETYDFGTGKGCLSLLVGSLVVGVIGGVILLLFNEPISALIQSQRALS
ncbi:MAG: HEAT repeat domain-containing protein [Anaerolineae bacterium]|nr:HEAT repeat domain-containing protein [Anaerolineae bacterium]